MMLRYKERSRRLHMAFWATGFCLIASGVIQAEPLNVQGSTTFTSRLLLPYQSEIEAAAGQKLVALPNKSSTGLIALFEGRADLAMISSSLESEVAVLKKTHSDLPFERLRSFEVSRVRAAFAVHPDNPVRKTSNDTMRRVLLGELTNWRELGGPDLPIRLVAVRAGGGVEAAIQQQLLGGTPMAAKDVIRVQIGTQVVRVTAQEPAFLGLAQVGNLQLKNLPEIELEQPVFQVLKFVTLDEPSPQARALIEATRKVAEARLRGE